MYYNRSENHALNSTAAIRYQYVNVDLFRCNLYEETYIAAFPGLLSMYWMKWRSNASCVFYCNKTETQRCLVNFHMHTTVMLRMFPLDVISLNIYFGSLDKEITKSAEFGSDKKLKVSSGSVFMEAHAFYAAEFWLDEISYGEHVSTIRPPLVNVGGNSVNTRNRTGTRNDHPRELIYFNETDSIADRGMFLTILIKQQL